MLREAEEDWKQWHSFSMVLWVKPESERWTQKNSCCLCVKTAFILIIQSATCYSYHITLHTTVFVGMLACLFRCVTGFCCYLDQTCLVIFVPSTACVLFWRHLLDMQGTKGINNIHPNVFQEEGARKKYWYWPCSLGIPIRGIQNMNRLKAWSNRGGILHSTGVQAGFLFWKLPLMQDFRGKLLCAVATYKEEWEHCRKTAFYYMQWAFSERPYHHTDCPVLFIFNLWL